MMIALCAVLAQANVPYHVFLRATASMLSMLMNVLTAALVRAYVPWAHPRNNY